jgi:hypothetical protein
MLGLGSVTILGSSFSPQITLMLTGALASGDGDIHAVNNIGSKNSSFLILYIFLNFGFLAYRGRRILGNLLEGLARRIGGSLWLFGE